MTKRIYIVLIVLICSTTAFSAVRELTLDSCLQLAKQNNPDIRKSELSVRRAEEVKAQALTKYFPQVQGTAFGYHALHPVIEVGIDDIGNASVRDLLTTLYGNYGAALGLENTLNLFQYGYVVGVSAVQPVYMGGKIVAGNKLAKVGVEAAKLQAQVEQRDRLEQVEESYWLVYALEQKQQIIDDATRLLDTLTVTLNGAIEAGLALPLDLTQVEMRRDEVLRRQLQLQSGKRLARRALALAIGVPQTDSIALVEPTAETDILLPRDTTAVTIEQQLLALQVQAEELKRRMVLADALPQLAVGANYSYSQWQNNILRNNFGSKTGNGALFVTLNVPLTAWWETSHKLREHQYAIEQAKIDEENLSSQLDLRTRQAYDRMVEAAMMVQLHERTVQHAHEAYGQTKVNYEAGMATITELLQAQTAWTQAKADLTDAQIAYRVHCRRYQDLICSPK